MKRTRKLARLAVATATIGAVSISDSALAGEPPPPDVDVIVNLHVRGPDANTVGGGLSIEFYEMPGGTPVVGNGECIPPAIVGSYPYNFESNNNQCSLPGEPVDSQDYAIGVAGAPEGWVVEAYCGTSILTDRITDGEPEFTILPFTYEVNCDVYVTTEILLLDKIVEGGPAASADFELEVFDSGGTLAGSGSDPADATCDLDYNPANCLALALPAGVGYAVGEVPMDYGYEVTDVTCDQYIRVDGGQNGNSGNEQIALPGATFDHDDGDTYCAVTNTYREGQLIVTTAVTNDEGGTASATDVSIEVFRTDGTEVVAATACAADGSCLDMMLPIGDYVIGYVGPAGYTREVTQVVQAPSEQITDDPDAEFTIAQFDIVEINVAIDDPTPPTTTTTTTTTTIAPTTTALGAGAGTLPATGTSSTANGWMAAMALLLLGAGSVLLMARRRPV